jgi:uncharacterized membrane protein YdjX (TVP38/TMEM64 family)
MSDSGNPTPPVRAQRNVLRGLLMLLPIVILAIAATQLSRLPAAQSTIEWIRSVAQEWWAIPLYLLLYVVFSVFLLPVGVLSAAAALAWGWKAGGVIELVSMTIASLVPFALARRGVKRLAWSEFSVESPFAVLLLRIVPVIPFVALNYITGATKLRTRDYLAVTFFGSIPSVFLFAYFVDTMSAGAMGTATQLQIIGACVLVAVVAVILRWAGGRLRARLTSAAPPS